MLSPSFSTLKISFWSVIGRMWDEQAPTQSHVEKIIETIQQYASNGDKILDFGCGAGIYSVALAKAGFDVIGIDAAEGMLARASLKLTPDLASHIQFKKVNANKKLPFSDCSFDVLIAISVLQTLDDPKRASREILRILKPNGIFIVLHFPKSNYHNKSVWVAIQDRIKIFKRKTLSNVILTSVKIIAERSISSIYWTVGELHNILITQGFHIVDTPETNPIIVVAKKPVAT